MSRFCRLAFLFFLLAFFLSIGVLGCPNPLLAEETSYYMVQDGDTLFSIANLNNTNINNLFITNDLMGTTIWPGQVLLIPRPEIDDMRLSSEDLDLLARVIHAEARGETADGKIAVGAVVLNRVASPYFPDTIREVIFQKSSNVYQFSPVGDGTINLEPDRTAIEAANIAAEGVDPTGGALYFYNPEIADDLWIRTLPVVLRIGNHIFARQ